MRKDWFRLSTQSDPLVSKELAVPENKAKDPLFFRFWLSGRRRGIFGWALCGANWSHTSSVSRTLVSSFLNV